MMYVRVTDILVFASVVAGVVIPAEEAGNIEQPRSAAGCTITAKHCQNFPEYHRTQFRDELGEEHNSADNNEAACLKRAEDFHHWCGNNASGGAQVGATYNPKQWSQLYVPGACENGWSQWDAFCYKYFWQLKTWPDAETFCREHDSHLASVHSHAENRFISTLAWGLKAWLGYTDVDKDTHYKWSDNTQDDFTNFAKNCTGREHEPDCKPEEVQQQWYSSRGTDTSPFVCKRNALLPLTLLQNTSADKLILSPWSKLLPSLASVAAGEIDGVPMDALLSLKLQKLPSVDALAANRPAPSQEPRFALPKGSLM